MTLALEGISIIDASQGVPGALAGMVLGDLGAEVLKVEPLDGDWLRQIGPFVKGESSAFLQLNRNKRGVAIDLKSPKGKEAFRRLARGSDAVIEAYRPGVMERLGLGYDALFDENSGLIYCGISAYGSLGPMAEAPGTELDVQAFVGKNRQIGRMGQPPLRLGFDMMSVNAGWAAAQAVIAALLQREKTGRGQKVETSLLHAAIALMQWASTAESDPDEWVAARPLVSYVEPPDHGFQAQDTPCLLDFGRAEEEWRQFCTVLGIEHIANDPRFNTHGKRMHNPELKAEMSEFLKQRPFEEIRGIAREFGASIMPVHTLASLDREPQAEFLGIFKELDHPVAGKYQTLNIPWKFSEPIARLAARPAPLLGQHTFEALGETGYEGAELQDMARSGTIYQQV